MPTTKEDLQAAVDKLVADVAGLNEQFAVKSQADAAQAQASSAFSTLHAVVTEDAALVVKLVGDLADDDPNT